MKKKSRSQSRLPFVSIVRGNKRHAGTPQGSGKLTWKQVAAIRARPEESCQALAVEFGVTKQLVHGIRTGVYWRDANYVPPPPRAPWSRHAADTPAKFLTRPRLGPASGERHPMAKLTWDDVREIRASREFARVLAEKYKVSIHTVHCVRQGRFWRDEPKAS